MKPLVDDRGKVEAVKEKGRKKGYREFKQDNREWQSRARMLQEDNFGSFAEVSCRAAACPMPLNLDVYDAIFCPYACKYCFACNFKSTLYTAFFDNSRSVGLRHCNLDESCRELDKLMAYRGKDTHSISGESDEKAERRIARVTASGEKMATRGGKSGWQAYAGSPLVALKRAVALEIPMRLGIRFEDFLPKERKLGISLGLLRYLSNTAYPTMVNTKSDLIGEDDYVDALAKNKGKAAVHVTLISSNNKVLKALEPGAPSYERRIWAMKQLASAGVRVVARIEPFLVYLSDPPDEVERYISDLKDAGVGHITFDTYSYTAKNPGMYQAFCNVGLDWDRLVLLGCDSQPLGSLLLGEFMKLFREKGIRCSTFDMGNVPDNDDDVCCEVGDWFRGGFNYGCAVMAARFIKRRGNQATNWQDFVNWVNEHGGFLSESLKQEVHLLWNVSGSNDAYSHGWARGLEPVGHDRDGKTWTWDGTDFRKDLICENI
jgi:hypothetical protein